MVTGGVRAAEDKSGIHEAKRMLQGSFTCILEYTKVRGVVLAGVTKLQALLR